MAPWTAVSLFIVLQSGKLALKSIGGVSLTHPQQKYIIHNADYHCKMGSLYDDVQ